MSRWRTALRGSVGGAATGVLTALADQLIRVLDPVLAASSTAMPGIVVYYMLPWAVLGFLCGALFRERQHRANAILVSTSVVVILGGYINQRWLPALMDPTSLIFDAVLLVGAAFLARAIWRRGGKAGLRLQISSLLILAVLAGSFLAGRHASRGDSRPPGSPTVEGPDVVVVVLDALRADHCSAYGYPRETTPALDSLAREGVLFERAYSVSSWTKPAVATLFTGMVPLRHGNHTVNASLPESVTTVPERFSAAGWNTAVFAENTFVSPLFGFDQGVNHFQGSDPPVYTQTFLGHMARQVAVRVPWLSALVDLGYAVDRLDAGQSNFAEDGIDLPRRVFEWVDGLGEGERFFAYVHLLKPHAPYRAPEELRRMFLREGSDPDAVQPPHVSGIGPFARADQPSAAKRAGLIDNYDARVRFGDRQLGEIVNGLRQRGRNPLFVVLADHGEEFGEHGLFDHGHSLQEDVVRIPLVVAWPGVLPAGERRSGIARLLDVPPSLLGWAGLAPEPQFDGGPLLQGGNEGRAVLLELHHGPRFGARGLVRDRMKLVVTEQGEQHSEQVFDLAADPAEDSSLAVPGSDPLVWMLAELETATAALRGRGMVNGATKLDPATEERLRALGYIH